MKKLTEPKGLPLSEVLEIMKKIQKERETKTIEQLINKIEDKFANGNFRYNETHNYIQMETTDWYDYQILDEMMSMYEKVGWQRVTVAKKNYKITICFYYKY